MWLCFYTVAKHHDIAPCVEEYYWDMTYAEIADECDCGEATVGRAARYLNMPRKTQDNRIEYEYGVPIDWLLDTLHNTLGKSVNQMSKDLDVVRLSITQWMDEHDIPRRGRSEAEKLKWSQMSDEERKKQVAAAHRASRKLPQFRLNANGYEEIRHCGEVAKHHRLLAVAEYGFDAVEGMAVHHKNNLSWDNRPDNIELLTPREHHQLHYENREINEDGRFV